MSSAGACTVLTVANRAEWLQFYDRVPAGQRCVYTDPDYLAFIAETYGYRAECVVFEIAEGFIAHPRLTRPLSALSFGGDAFADAWDAVSSWYFGGPYVVAEDESKAAELVAVFWPAYRQDCIDRGVVSEFFRFDPNRQTHRALAEVVKVEENRQTVFVDLEQSEESIVAGYREACRRGVRQAIDSGLVVVPTADDTDWEVFARIYMDEMSRKEAPSHLRFDRDFFDRARHRSDDLTLLVARDREETVGGFIVAHGYGVAHHFLSASLPAYWDKRINNLLFHEAIHWSKRAGFAIFDFQGGRDGVFRFKKNFSRQRRKFYTARVIHDANRYDALVAAHAARHGVSDTVDDFFPAYRRGESN